MEAGIALAEAEDDVAADRTATREDVRSMVEGLNPARWCRKLIAKLAPLITLVWGKRKIAVGVGKAIAMLTPLNFTSYNMKL